MGARQRAHLAIALARALAAAKCSIHPVQYLMSFLVKLNDKYNVYKYVNFVEYL